jgi:hypothetical protein
MTTCVLFNDKGEFQGMIVAEPTDWVEDGWRLEVVPEGHTWGGKSIVTDEEYLAIINKQVTPEVI